MGDNSAEKLEVCMVARLSSRSLLMTALAALAAVSLAGCANGGSGKKKKFAYVERPVERLYADAARQLERKRYPEAVAGFEEVERQHPYSAWARRAILMKAFAQYQDNEYEDAVKTLDEFISLHPGNKDAPYAYYLKAMSFYERITSVGRDQKNTDDAVAALNDVVKRYPNTEYARDARLKLDLTYDHLAAKEMYVGRYYQRNNETLAAVNRYRTVVEKYQTTSHVPEALHRLVECYMLLGLVNEAQRSAAVLGYNYPGTTWYQDSWRLLEKRKLVDAKAPMPGKELKVANAEEAAALGIAPPRNSAIAPPAEDAPTGADPAGPAAREVPASTLTAAPAVTPASSPASGAPAAGVDRALQSNVAAPTVSTPVAAAAAPLPKPPVHKRRRKPAPTVDDEK